MTKNSPRATSAPLTALLSPLLATLLLGMAACQSNTGQNNKELAEDDPAAYSITYHLFKYFHETHAKESKLTLLKHEKFTPGNSASGSYETVTLDKVAITDPAPDITSPWAQVALPLRFEYDISMATHKGETISLSLSGTKYYTSYSEDEYGAIQYQPHEEPFTANLEMPINVPTGLQGYDLYLKACVLPLEHEDLAGLSAEDIKWLRYEILARRGAIFTEEAVAEHFNTMGWYEPYFEDVSAELNAAELQNIDFLQAAEAAL